MNEGSPGDGKPIDPPPCEVQPQCPICDGHMETVYSRQHQSVCQCVDCGCTLTVPTTARHIALQKQRKIPAA